MTDAFGGYGGISVYNRDVLTALCANPAIEEVVAIPRLVPNQIEKLPKKLRYITTGVASLTLYLKTLSKLIVRDRQFNVVICGHINMLPAAWLAAKWLNIPLVLQIYGIDAWQPSERFLANILIKQTNLVFSISHYTKDRFQNWTNYPEENIRLLPNAIRLDSYGVGPKPEGLVERYNLKNKKVLLTFGRLVSKERAKGFDEILDVLPDLIETIPNLVYIIAGAGEYSGQLEQKVASLNLHENVVFTGMVKEEEKADLYRLSDVYVMPSRGEGFGFVFLEAMACGIPVIASKVDGSRDAVRDGQLGQLVDPDDSAKLKTAIIDALAKKKEVPDGLEYFSYDNFSKRLNGSINTLLEDRYE